MWSINVLLYRCCISLAIEVNGCLTSNRLEANTKGFDHSFTLSHIDT